MKEETIFRLPSLYRDDFRVKAYTFGDGSNDITMLKAAGIGVVMGNAEPDILPYGDIIAPTCDEDGVADVLERLVL